MVCSLLLLTSRISTDVRVVKSLVQIERFSGLCVGNALGWVIMARVGNGKPKAMTMNRRLRRRTQRRMARQPSGGLPWWVIAVVVGVVLIVAASRILQ